MGLILFGYFRFRVPWATLADHPGPERISPQTREGIGLNCRGITFPPRPPRHPLPGTLVTGLVQKANPLGHLALIGFLHHLPYEECDGGLSASRRSGSDGQSCPRNRQSGRPPHPSPLPEALPLAGEDVEAAGLQPIRVVITDRAGIGILVPVPRPGLPGLSGQRLARQPYPRPGVVEAKAEFVQAQVPLTLCLSATANPVPSPALYTSSGRFLCERCTSCQKNH